MILFTVYAAIVHYQIEALCTHGFTTVHLYEFLHLLDFISEEIRITNMYFLKFVTRNRFQAPTTVPVSTSLAKGNKI